MCVTTLIRCFCGCNDHGSSSAVKSVKCQMHESSCAHYGIIGSRDTPHWCGLKCKGLRTLAPGKLTEKLEMYTHARTPPPPSLPAPVPRGLEETVAEDVAHPLFVTRHGRANTLDT
jgi:hypothetical protein